MLYLKTLSMPKSMFIYNCNQPCPLKSLFIPYMVQSQYADPILWILDAFISKMKS